MTLSRFFLIVASMLIGGVAAPSAMAQTHFTSCVSLTGNDAQLGIQASILPTIGGSPIENGDEIAVFTPEGLCAGVGVWNGSNMAITVWGDNGLTGPKDGMASGDTLKIRIWDSSVDQEWGDTLGYVNLTYNSSQPFYRTDGKYGADAIYQLSSLSVTVPPAAATLAEPANGTTGVVTTPTLKWNALAGADAYEIAVSTTSDFQTYTVLESGLTDTTYVVSTLSHLTTYYWQVRGTNIGGAGPCSVVASFTTVIAPPGAPTLSAPVDGAADQSVSTTVTWQSVATADSYDLEVSTHSDFSSIDVATVNGLTTTSHALSGLSNDVTYYWRVRANNAGGSSTYTSQSFITTAIHALTIASGWNMISSYVNPSNGDFGTVFGPVSGSLVLAKDGSGGVYWPDLSINSLGTWDRTKGYVAYFTSGVSLDISGVSAVPESTPISLTTGWNYTAFWGKASTDVVTAVQSISADLVAVKNIAGEIYLPGSGINNLGNLVPGQGYKIYVSQASSLTYPAYVSSKNGGGNAVVRAGLASSAALVVRGSRLVDGQVVTVWDGARLVGSAVVESGGAVVNLRGDDPITASIDGARVGSRLDVRLGRDASTEPLRFDSIQDVLTKSFVSADELRFADDAIWQAALGAVSDSEAPLEFALKGNYPNPFNPSTTIEYSLKDAGRTTLTIFNMLGQEVRVLVDQNQEPGRYRVTLDASGLTSGVYVYRLTSGGQTRQNRMLLLK